MSGNQNKADIGYPYDHTWAQGDVRGTGPLPLDSKFGPPPPERIFDTPPYRRRRRLFFM